MTNTIVCPLCNGPAIPYHTHLQRRFLQCGTCLSVFQNPEDYLDIDAEKAHYLTHNNDPEDVRYQNFVSPVTNAVLEDFDKGHKGLDFGSGTGSPIFKVLRDNGYDLQQYDLFFHNNPELLTKSYDYIACSETAEHFKEPYLEFFNLRKMLNPGGKLYVMTERFDPARDFATWYYKSDPTHVFLYHANAFEWIRNAFGFKTLELKGRVAELTA